MTKLVKQPTAQPSLERAPDDTPKAGEWYWVSYNEEEEGKAAKRKWLGCVVHVGSNYAKIEGVVERGAGAAASWQGESYKTNQRIHFDVFHERCTREENPDAFLTARVQHHQGEVRRLMGEVQELTALLGVGKREALTDGTEAHALVVQTSSQPIEDYKKALVKAKEKTLPKLFKEIKKENEAIALWMTATTIPLKAEADALEGTLDRINGRIFTVELYAGLTENVKQITEGEPAPLATPIHLMQRRCYMDEECLAEYEAGGMDFESLEKFDEWLARPSNFSRILPFPRCVVAFRVRRHTKDRGVPVNLSGFFDLKMKMDADKWTFLYLRNGDRLYRLNTSLEFDAKLFPDLDRQQLTGRLWAKMWSSEKVERLVTDGEYQEMKCERAEALERLKSLPELPSPGTWETSKMERKYGEEYEKHYQAWQAKYDAAGKRSSERHRLQYTHSDLDSFHPYEPADIHYDDISKYLADQMAQHNRIVLILQGLLDRSPVFHPHPPWQIFTQAGFEHGLKLVLDDDRALVAGEKPDFEAYRNTLNGFLKKGSVTVGQQKRWLRAEAKKEIARRDANWRYRGERHYRDHLKEFQPYGDLGPGDIARIANYSAKTGKATYRWERERVGKRTWRNRDKGDFIGRAFTVDTLKVLNVDAYEPGDFKIFFADPRTRSEYLKWAPLLLQAEDYKAGKVHVRGEQGAKDDE